MQDSGKARWTRIALWLQSAFCILHLAVPASAAQQDLVGQPVVEVVVEQEGQRLSDPLLQSLIQTRIGQPLAMRDVRETLDHLINLQRFDDIQPIAEAIAGGVRVRYVLVPSHPVDRVEFRGSLGLSEGDVRRVINDRYGRTPAASRVAEAAKTLQAEYRRRGYPGAQVMSRVEEAHNPDRASLIFDIESGRRARIAAVQYIQIDPGEEAASIGRPAIRQGEPYDPDAVQAALRRWEERLKSEGYYQARASFGASMPDDAYLTVNLLRGPRVVLEFSGDPLPAAERDRLVPIRAEGSADEDLLEDAKLAIEDYLHARGYRDAVADYTRTEQRGELKITFHITEGPRYTIDSIRITGNRAFLTSELDEILRMTRGDLFVRAAVDARVAAVESAYRTRGFTRAQVMVDEAVLAGETNGADRHLEVTVNIMEGPQTSVRAVTFSGNTVLSEAELRGLVPAAGGARYLAVEAADGRDRIELEYRNRGYANVVVRQDVVLADNDTQADLKYTIVEGPQALVEHIIVVGNERTKTKTILDELRVHEGEPLGYSALLESRRALDGLGLFRRVDIQALEHTGEPGRDVLIQIEEADATTLGWGGGLEGTLRARPTGPGGTAEDRLELAPRGFFEIGRRNLWGKNRSVNLYTRVSLRSTDIDVSQSGVRLEEDQTQTNLGFNEYRVVGTFREPRFLSRRSELLITGIVEQAIRTTFNFSRRIARSELAVQIRPQIALTGRYSFEKTKLFDEIFTPEEKPLLIDKLFPEVRLSKFAGSLIRDTRDDGVDPAHGALVTVDGDVAARAIGSEVGFVKTYVQGFLYRQLPVQRRLVLALGGRVGVARGFERIKGGLAVRDLPASERFFGGGDTTVRGFSLDRLGDESTISQTGFPLGGNGIVIVNGELRVKVFGALQAVGFIDAGNVFALASDLDFTNLRPAAGFGIRVASPIGPVRLDLGFNLDPKEFAGVPEKRLVFHISLGQAF